MDEAWASAARNGRPYEHVLGRSRAAGLALWPALVGIGLGLSSSSFAFTITESPGAPAANLLESQLDDATGVQDNNRNFTDNGGPPGQTFTLDAAGSFQMTGFTLQGRGDAGGGALTADWSIQLGTVDPISGEIISLLTETSTVALAANNNYVTFNFDAPLTITGGVQYAFSVYSSVGWYGFAHSSTDVYGGGFAFSNNTSIDNPGNNTGGARRAFNGFAAPDPGAYDYVFAVQGFALGTEKIWSGEVGGVANGTWNTALTNFSGSAYANGDSPVFGDFAADGTTPVATRNITIQPAGVTPTSVSVENSNGDYTFDGAIRNAPLTKTGTSALTLAGSTDNTGLNVNHNQGLLRLAKTSSATVHAVENLTVAAGATAQVTGTGGDQISNTGAVTVNGILDLNGANEAIDGLSGTTGSVTNDGGGAATLTIGAGGGGGSFTGTIINNSNATAGTIALVKTGAGTIALNGANTYTGGTRIEGGTLALGADYAQAQTATLGSGPVTVTGGGQLRFGGIGGALQEFTFPNAITLDNGRLFANDGLHHVTGVVTVGSGGGVLGAQWATKDLSLEGGLSGSGSLTIVQEPNNGGAVLLATNNSATYSGAITIQSPGILRTVVPGALGTGSVTVDGTLDLLNNSQTVPLNGGAGTIAVGDATLTVPAGTFSGAMTSGAAGRLIIGGGTLALSGPATISTPTISLQPGSVLDAAGTDTGGLTLGAQNLNGAGTIGGTLQTSDGSSISPGVGTNSVTGRIGTINVGTVTLPSSLTLNSGTTLNYVLGTPGTNTPGNSSLISVQGDLFLPATGVNVNFIDNANADGLGSLGNGLYRLFAYTGSLIGFEPDSTFAGPEGRSYTFSSTATTNGALDVRISTLGLSWTGLDNGTGAVNSLWTDAVATKNWANGTVATNFATGVSVTFSDTNAVTSAPVTNGNVQVKAGGVNPASVVFDNAAVNYVLTSADATGITGSASLVKHGTGTVALNGANTYTGPTTLNGGLVRLGNPNALGATSTVHVGELATLDLNGQNTSAGALTGGGTITNDAAGGTTILTVGNTDLDGAFSGIIEDGTSAITVVKTGIGTQVFNGPSTYSGGTTISGGTVGLGADYAQADDAALGTGPVTVTGAAQLRFGGIGGALREFTIPNAITLNDGTLFANDSLQHLTGGLTIAAGGGRLGAQWATKNLSIEGTITGSGPLTIFQEPANGGRVIFAADNRATYSGAVTIQVGGILQTSVSGAMGTGPVTVNGTLDLAGSEQSIASLEGLGAITLGAGTLTVEEGSFSGIVSGTGGFTKSGPATVSLNGANTYTGNTNVTEGILEVTELGELYDVEYTAVPVVNVSGGATLRVAGWQFNEPGSLGGLDFSPTKLIVDNGIIEYTGVGNVPDNSGRNFAVGTGGATLRASGTGLWTLLEDTRGDYNTVVNDSSLTLDGAGDGRLEKPIVGVGSLTKRGAGTWTVSGQSSYFGPTAVEAGTLMVSGSINGTSGVTVANNARLGGGGIITTSGDGSVTVAAGGKLVPGDGLGTLTFDLIGGSLDISAGVATQPGGLVFELDTPDFSDRIAILTGKLNIGTGVLGFEDFSFLAGQGFAPGVYTLFESEEPIVGSLAANREGVINGMISTLAFGENNQDITLTVIPEPSAALTLMAGMGWLLGLQKFRRRSRGRPTA